MPDNEPRKLRGMTRSQYVLLASGTLAVTALQSVTRTVAVVFVNLSDAVGAGLVDSLARSGGNTTGFMVLEYGSSDKW